jgi:hypothetical protein
MNIKQLMLDSLINAFGADLFLESFLKSPMASAVFERGKPLDFFYPINRGDCKEWAGVQVTLMPIKNPGSTEGGANDDV